jgi:hypothetical protein
MIIKVNGYKIYAAQTAMISRKERRIMLDGGKVIEQSGVWLCFSGGGQQWIADPEAQEVEAQFMRYDGVQESELPY